MRFRANIYLKITIVLISIIAVTMLLYGMSYRKNVAVITDQIKNTDLNHLDFFTKQMDNNVNLLAGSAYSLQRDSSIREYAYIQELGSLIDPNKTTLTVLEKLALQTGSSTWDNGITVYNLRKREALSSDASVLFDESLVKGPLPKGWDYGPTQTENAKDSEFRLLLTDPVDFGDRPALANMIIKVHFPISNLQKMLEAYKYSGDTFLYHPSFGLIQKSNSDPKFVPELINSLKDSINGSNLSTMVTLQDKQYLVSMIRSSSLGWFMIHYSPIEQILHPIQSSKSSFLFASVALLILSSIFSLLLFRQVQRPISVLLRAVNKLKEGDLSARIRIKTNNEFTVLNQGFNDMAEKTQILIEQVYLEQLRAKDAHLKQLQSQINPHFLNNCLFFMKSKAKVGDTDAVQAMALNLGEYYRYMTRLDDSLTTIREELQLLQNYLAIQNLRKQRIDYTIQIPDEFMQKSIPRLLIQPLVENSIIHGIEKKNGLGMIAICGERKDGWLMISVEDNGVGMDSGQITALYAKLDAPALVEGGFGLWNVQQRLKHHYGESSGLLLAKSGLGGVALTLRIQYKELEYAADFTR